MSSPLGNKQNVTVFVLYLMQNVGYPMDFATVNDIVMQTDYVAYLDFAESFSRMEDGGLVEKVGDPADPYPVYRVTDKGRTVVESLQSEILPSILEESLTCALRHLDFKRRGVKASCRSAKNPLGGYDFICTITEGETVLLSITLWTDTRERAARMEEQFRRYPENTYRATLALMSGNVNYLFDS
jgi:DNA-binding MarR family transcriptional regulator